jgi:hypothetical protein
MCAAYSACASFTFGVFEPFLTKRLECIRYHRHDPDSQKSTRTSKTDLGCKSLTDLKKMLRITVLTLQLPLEYISEKKIFGPNKSVGSFDSVNKSVGNFDFGNKSVSNLTSVNKSVGSQIKSI